MLTKIQHFLFLNRLVGLYKGYFLFSITLFFLKSCTETQIQSEQSIQFGYFKIADDVVFFLVCDLQCALECFMTKREAVEMRISASTHNPWFSAGKRYSVTLPGYEFQDPE